MMICLSVCHLSVSSPQTFNVHCLDPKAQKGPEAKETPKAMKRYNSKDRHKPERAQTIASNQAQASSAHMHPPVQLESGA